MRRWALPLVVGLLGFVAMAATPLADAGAVTASGTGDLHNTAAASGAATLDPAIPDGEPGHRLSRSTPTGGDERADDRHVATASLVRGQPTTRRVLELLLVVAGLLASFHPRVRRFRRPRAPRLVLLPSRGRSPDPSRAPPTAPSIRARRHPAPRLDVSHRLVARCSEVFDVHHDPPRRPRRRCPRIDLGQGRHRPSLVGA